MDHGQRSMAVVQVQSKKIVKARRLQMKNGYRLIVGMMILILLISLVESATSLSRDHKPISGKEIIINRDSHFNQNNILGSTFLKNPLSQLRVTQTESKQCLELMATFNSELNDLLNLLNSASDQSLKGYICSSGNCPLNEEAEDMVGTLTKQVPKIKQCLDKKVICQKMLFISNQMGLRETVLFAKIATKMGSSYEIIQAILLESPLYQFSTILSSFLKYARGELC